MILHQHVSSIPIPFGSGSWFIGTYRQSFPTPRNTTPYTFTHPNWPKRTHTHITHTLNLGVQHQMQWTYEEVCVSCVFSISCRKSTLVLVVEIITLFIGTYTKCSRSLSCTYLTFHRIKEQPYTCIFAPKMQRSSSISQGSFCANSCVVKWFKSRFQWFDWVYYPIMDSEKRLDLEELLIRGWFFLLQIK